MSRSASRSLLLGLLLVLACAPPARGAGADPGGRLERVRELTRLGAYASAESLGRAVLDDAERAFAPTSPRLLEALDAYVEVAGRGARATLPETRALAERAAQWHERSDGPAAPAAAESWVRLARPLIAQSRPDSAQGLLDRAARRFEECGAGCRERLAEALLVRGTLDFHRRDYPAQLVHVRQAVQIVEALSPPDSLALAMAWSALGRSHLTLNDDANAAADYQRAIPLLEHFASPVCRELGAAINNLGILARRQGDYLRTCSLFERALALALLAEGPSSEGVALYHDNLSWVRQALGDLAGARRDAQEAFDLRTRLFGPDHPLTVHSLLQLEDALRTIGDYSRSFDCAERAYQSARRVPGPDSLYVARAAAALGQEYQAVGRTREARASFEEALRLRRSGAGAEADQVAWLTGQVGRTWADAADHEQAIRYYREAIRLQESQPHYFLSETLGRLAESEAALGRLAEARELRARAWAIRDSVVGPGSQATLHSLADLARAEYDLGQRREALDHALAVEAGARRQLRSMTGALTEAEALSYAEVRASGLDLLQSLAASPGALGADDRRRVYDALIRSRALVFDDLADRRRSLRTEEAATARLLDELQGARAELAARVVSFSRGTPSAFQLQALAAAGSRREAAERAFNASSPGYRRDRAREAIGFDAVRAGLPADAALVSFLRYRALEPRGRHARPDRAAYLAWVFSPALEAPVAIALGDAARIDSLAMAWHAALATPPPASPARARAAEQSCAALGAGVRRAIWDPLQARLGAAGRVFLVPDGALQLVNFAALPAGRGRYLVETGPLVHTLTTERDLVEPDSSLARGSGLLAVGGPDFERTSDPRQDPQAVGKTVQSIPAAPGEPASEHFPPLSGATEEVIEISKIWREAAISGAPTGDRGDVLCLTGADATEGAIKRFAPGHRVLHVATHSFRLRPVPAALAMDGTRGIGGMAPSFPPTGVPAVQGLDLAEMGLVLAGAERAPPGGTSAEDGYLTAEEILSLDLRGVEWAVLSACETGVPDGEFIENVRGFHRALRTAGASTVVMSLWPVADQPTREWMDALYTARIRGGRSTAEAIRDASRAMLAARRARGSSTHPFEWASFVGAGDWR